MKSLFSWFLSVIMTMSVAMSATMTMFTTIMFVPTFMPAIIMPVVTVSFVAAVADDHLVPATPVTRISYPIGIIVTPWVRTIDHYFVATINIIITIPHR